MTEESAPETKLLRSQKARLIEVLSGDADFVLQHADSRCLLSAHGYQQVKACRTPAEKVTDLLDHIIQRGPEAAQGLLELLRDEALQETFPRLSFVKDLQVNKDETSRKRERGDSEETIPSKKIHSSGSHLVKEKELMAVARVIGRSWKEIGRLALDVPSVKLEQIEEDNALHVERVFAMLRYWSSRQREKATAAYLHSLLCQEDLALPIENIDFLLKSD